MRCVRHSGNQVTYFSFAGAIEEGIQVLGLKRYRCVQNGPDLNGRGEGIFPVPPVPMRVR